MPLDEQQLVEAQQRVAKGDLAADSAGVGEQGIAGLGAARVDRRIGRLEPGQFLLQRGKSRGGGGSLQIGQQRGGPAQHDVGGVAVAVADQGLRPERLLGHLGEMSAVGDVVAEGLELAFPLLLHDGVAGCGQELRHPFHRKQNRVAELPAFRHVSGSDFRPQHGGGEGRKGSEEALGLGTGNSCHGFDPPDDG